LWRREGEEKWIIEPDGLVFSSIGELGPGTGSCGSYEEKNGEWI